MLVKVVEICWGMEAGMGGGMVRVWGSQPPIDEFIVEGALGAGEEGGRKEMDGWRVILREEKRGNEP